MKEKIEKERSTWKKVAEKNNWEQDDIYVQVWFNRDGSVRDSVSHVDMEGDILLFDGVCNG